LKKRRRRKTNTWLGAGVEGMGVGRRAAGGQLFMGNFLHMMT